MSEEPVMGNAYYCLHPDHGASPEEAFVQRNVGASVYWCPVHGPIVAVGADMLPSDTSYEEAGKIKQMPERFRDRNQTRIIEDDDEHVALLKKYLHEEVRDAQKYQYALAALKNRVDNVLRDLGDEPLFEDKIREQLEKGVREAEREME